MGVNGHFLRSIITFGGPPYTLYMSNQLKNLGMGQTPLFDNARIFPVSHIQQVSMVTKNIHILYMYSVHSTGTEIEATKIILYVDNGVIGGFGSEDFRDVKHHLE